MRTPFSADAAVVHTTRWSFVVEAWPRKALPIVLVIGIIGPGFIDYLLSATGASQLGAVVWAFGYGTTILIIWYGWIRPLDLSGPDTTNVPWTVDDDSEPEENQDPAETEERTPTQERAQ